ncbi:hypothetical protein [Prochlorococcus marinus]|uniref:Uncharacterized protein n=1 Tax=Prochlorococcus marinus (strain MIT 9211) TaxID=93059 RepID=A9B9S4_PROM4|nr:hypothetical protein [Prochlorococcus marinus]ABX08586.1 Hypothetical protein P9211_06551 [Prochlorococcus marinus str. MIT 9211]
MLKALFWGMLGASSAYYGDSIGLAPIALGRQSMKKIDPCKDNFWARECALNPNRIACLNYES